MSAIRVISHILLIVCVAVSAVLVIRHAGHADAIADGIGSCGRGGECDQVLESRWAWFPPLEAGNLPAAEGSSSPTAAGESPSASGIVRASGVRIPVALVGLCYFSALLLWLLIADPWYAASVGPRRALVIVVLFGAVSSVGFIALMAFVIGAYCPLCLLVHAANLLLTTTIVFSHIRPACSSGDTGGRIPIATGWRRAACAAMAILGICSVELALYRSLARPSGDMAEVGKGGSEAVANGDQDQAGIELLDAAFLAEPEVLIPMRGGGAENPAAPDQEEEAVLAAADGLRNELVVFGDVECGACRRFHDVLHTLILPSHAGHLHVVFKHLPYDQRHPNARKAAKALEAARRQGRFAEFLDALHEWEGSLAGFDYAGTIRELELDVTQFVREMTSPEVAERIAEDESLARQLGVEATPAVYLNGRRVDASLLKQEAFWDLQADRLRERRHAAGQGWGESNSEGLAAGGPVASSR